MQDKYDQNSQAQEWPFHCILNEQKTDIKGMSKFEFGRNDLWCLRWYIKT